MVLILVLWAGDQNTHLNTEEAWKVDTNSTMVKLISNLEPSFTIDRIFRLLEELKKYDA